VSGTIRGKSSPEHWDRRRGPHERRRQVAGKAMRVVVFDEFQNPSSRGQVWIEPHLREGQWLGGNGDSLLAHSYTRLKKKKKSFSQVIRNSGQTFADEWNVGWPPLRANGTEVVDDTRRCDVARVCTPTMGPKFLLVAENAIESNGRTVWETWMWT
jgi:hypothetical protein